MMREDRGLMDIWGICPLIKEKNEATEEAETILIVQNIDQRPFLFVKEYECFGIPVA